MHRYIKLGKVSSSLVWEVFFRSPVFGHEGVDNVKEAEGRVYKAAKIYTLRSDIAAPERTGFLAL